MKTNISSLMIMLSNKESDLSAAKSDILDYAVNTSIQELDGTVNVTEDYKVDFDEAYSKIDELIKDIVKIKATINAKNNEFKLSDGRSIQEAIAENGVLRKMRITYKTLLCKKASKRRETEVNNSYFECRTLNFDAKELKAKVEELDRKIKQTDFEISRLNSIEFEY